MLGGMKLGTPFDPIETARLRLRCARLDDAAALSALMTPAISDWVASWPSPLPLDVAERRMVMARAAAWSGDAMPCIVEERDARVVGWVDVNRSNDTPRLGTMGYWIGDDFQGRGYAVEAAGALLDASFDRLGIDVVEAGAQLANAGSFAVMRKIGMSPIGERTLFVALRQREERVAFYAKRRP